MIRVPCTVRQHVSADVLLSWSDMLSPASVLLQILQADGPTAEELASCMLHLTQQTEIRNERITRRQEVVAWTEQVRFEARVGCGLRRCERLVSHQTWKWAILSMPHHSTRTGALLSMEWQW